MEHGGWKPDDGMVGVFHIGANCRVIKLYRFFTGPGVNRRKWLIEHSKLDRFFTKNKVFKVKFLLVFHGDQPDITHFPTTRLHLISARRADGH